MSGSRKTLTCVPRQGSFAISDENETESILANGPDKIHGESRERVLKSGGRVDKGVDTKRGVLVGTGDSGRESRTTPVVILGQTAGDLS